MLNVVFKDTPNTHNSHFADAAQQAGRTAAPDEPSYRSLARTTTQLTQPSHEELVAAVYADKLQQPLRVQASDA